MEGASAGGRRGGVRAAGEAPIDVDHAGLDEQVSLAGVQADGAPDPEGGGPGLQGDERCTRAMSLISVYTVSRLDSVPFPHSVTTVTPTRVDGARSLIEALL